MDDELDVPLGQLAELARGWDEQARALELTGAALDRAPTDGFTPAAGRCVTEAIGSLGRRVGEVAATCTSYADTVGDCVREAWRIDGVIGARLVDLLLGLDR